LSGYRSIRSVEQRYRIVYKIEQEQVVVVIVGIGRRKEGDKQDVYAIIQDLISKLLIDVEDES
jgi:mRNA interferase RelE/StbE